MCAAVLILSAVYQINFPHNPLTSLKLPPSFWRKLILQIKWHLLFSWRFRFWLLVTLGVLFLWGVFSSRQLLSAPSPNLPHVGDGLLFALAGPPFGFSGLTPLLAWLLGHLFFFVLIGDIANSQLQEHGYAMALRLGSRQNWWFGLVAVIVIIAFAYTILILVATLGGVMTQLGWRIEPSPFFAEQGFWDAASEMSLTLIITVIFGLTFSSLLVTGVAQTLISLKTGKSAWAFTAVVALAIATWAVGLSESVAVWQQWLPPAQSIVSRHWPFELRLPGFTFNFSLAYNSAAFFLLVIIGWIWLSAFDFMGIQNDE